MSFKVLIIPEYPTNNGYILKPLIKRMMKECGKPNAQVDVLSNPRVQGYDNAKTLRSETIFERICSHRFTVVYTRGRR
jgi:hypothetical protein